MRVKAYILFSVLLLLWNCGGQAPQRPSQRKGEAPKVDSAQLALMELNMRLAEAADQQLAQAVQAQEEVYALYEGKVWMHTIDRGDEQRAKPKNGDICTLHMRVFSLSKKMLVDTEGSYCLGKNELPHGVDCNLPELYPGAKVRMYAPWYAAYGQQGTEHIPPYENVIIEFELK